MAIPHEPAFPRAEFERRVAATQRSLADRGLDALLLFGPHNVFYLSGMDSENLFDFQCLIVGRDGEPVLVILDFEEARAANTVAFGQPVSYHAFDDPVAIVADQVRQMGVGGGRLGLEQRAPFTLTPALLTRFRAALPEATFDDPFGIVEDLRLVKSDAEVAYQRQAAALTDRAVLAAYDALRPGVRDNEIAAVIMDTFYRGGSDTVCWGPIVASGYRAGSAHSSFNGRRIQAGETVFLEVTGEVRKYTAPLMRTAILGQPTPEIARVADAGARAVETILDTARAGVPAADVARAAGKVVEPILDGIVFHHNFGYPVGIGYPGTWIETLGFFLRIDNPRPLKPGMVFHLPMSFRKFGEFGANQSHTIRISEEGPAEALTKTEARLRVLGGA